MIHNLYFSANRYKLHFDTAFLFNIFLKKKTLNKIKSVQRIIKTIRLLLLDFITCMEI